MSFSFEKFVDKKAKGKGKEKPKRKFDPFLLFAVHNMKVDPEYAPYCIESGQQMARTNPHVAQCGCGKIFQISPEM